MISTQGSTRLRSASSNSWRGATRGDGGATAKTETGDPLDFQTHIHRDVLRRASEKILSRKAIQPTTSAEIQDDCRWHPASRGLQGLEG